MAFTEKRKGSLIYMTSDKLPVFNAFSTRHGGVSTGIWESLNLGSKTGDDLDHVKENYRRFCALAGAGPDECCVTSQVHGAEVRVVTSADRHTCGDKVPYIADGLVTAESGLPIMCFTADCVPVLMCDAVNHVAAAVHCGWRSSAADILGNAAAAMKSLGAEERHIYAAMGAALGRCCFESDRDVPDALEAYLSGDTEGLFDYRDDGKIMVDLRMANERRLLQLGIPRENIDISGECTYCMPEKYWSHRYTKGKRGTMGAVIVLP